MSIDGKAKRESIRCDLCGNDKNVLFLRTRDYRYGYAEYFNFMRCLGCGLIYMNPRPTADWICKRYDEDYTSDADLKRMDLSIDSSKWKTFLRPLWQKFVGGYKLADYKIGGKFLDVGCGAGEALCVAKEHGMEPFGIEINPKLVKICKDKGLNAHCGTLEEINFPDNYFDTVWISQVIEHVCSPKDLLREVKRILKQNGRVYIFCPNLESYLSKLFGRYWEGWYVPFHFYVFTASTMRRLGAEVGLKVEKIETSTPDRFFIVSAKGYLWGERSSGSSSIERGRIFDTILFRAFISVLLRTLDLVFEGRGDCLKIVLSKT